MTQYYGKILRQPYADKLKQLLDDRKQLTCPSDDPNQGYNIGYNLGMIDALTTALHILKDMPEQGPISPNAQNQVWHRS